MYYIHVVSEKQGPMKLYRTQSYKSFSRRKGGCRRRRRRSGSAVPVGWCVSIDKRFDRTQCLHLTYLFSSSLEEKRIEKHALIQTPENEKDSQRSQKCHESQLQGSLRCNSCRG
jgi:hypothetical protein